MSDKEVSSVKVYNPIDKVMTEAKNLWRILTASPKQWYFPNEIWNIIISYAVYVDEAFILENGWGINKRNLGNNHHLYFTCRKHNKYRCGFSPLYFLEKKNWSLQKIKEEFLHELDCSKELFEKYITSQRYDVPRCIHGYRGACRLVNKCRYYYPLPKNDTIWMRYWGESRRQWTGGKFDSDLWEYARGGKKYDTQYPGCSAKARWEGKIFNHKACSDWVEEEKFRGSIKVLNADVLEHFYNARRDAQSLRSWREKPAQFDWSFGATAGEMGTPDPSW